MTPAHILSPLPCRLHGGELFDYVIAKEYLDENEAVYYMRQILDGLSYLHKKCIVHLDLKVQLYSMFGRASWTVLPSTQNQKFVYREPRSLGC